MKQLLLCTITLAQTPPRLSSATLKKSTPISFRSGSDYATAIQGLASVGIQMTLSRLCAGCHRSPAPSPNDFGRGDRGALPFLRRHRLDLRAAFRTGLPNARLTRPAISKILRRGEARASAGTPAGAASVRCRNSRHASRPSVLRHLTACHRS
jgi:hypothetical protein